MATTVDEVLSSGAARSVGTEKLTFTLAIDRWIYVIMAASFVVLTLVGFVPDSIVKLAAVDAGEREAFPASLHVHAVLMGAWLLLLLAQTLLMATGRATLHRQLGIASLVVAPAIVVTWLIVIPTMNLGQYDQIAAMPAGPERTGLEAGSAIVTDILLYQLRDGILFPLFVGLGLLARRRDFETHKRLMILATAILIPASFVRMTWLPTTMPASPNSIVAYTLLLISPMFLWDLYRRHNVQRAYLIFIASYGPLTLVAGLLWGSPWWLQNGPRLLGLAT